MQTGQTAETAAVDAGIDYWEFTVPYDKGWDVLTVFPGGYEQRRNKRGDVIGWRGYTNSAHIAQGKGLVGWSPADRRMGVHFSLGSEALRVMAALDPWWQDLPSVMGAVLDELDGHSTRVDVCWDDQTGVLDIDDIERARQAGSFVSRWKDNDYHNSTRKGVAGATVGFGSPKSDSYLRIYDKRAERLQKGHEVEADHWVRVELQLRRKRADAVARLYATAKENAHAVMVKLAGLLRSMLEFKAPSTDSNKQRQPIAPWWGRFLGYVEKARLATVKPEARTVADSQRHVEDQYGATLATIEQALGFDKFWSWAYAVVDDGRARMGPRHKAMLALSGVPV